MLPLECKAAPKQTESTRNCTCPAFNRAPAGTSPLHLFDNASTIASSYADAMMKRLSAQANRLHQALQHVSPVPSMGSDHETDKAPLLQELGVLPGLLRKHIDSILVKSVQPQLKGLPRDLSMDDQDVLEPPKGASSLPTATTKRQTPLLAKSASPNNGTLSNTSSLAAMARSAFQALAKSLAPQAPLDVEPTSYPCDMHRKALALPERRVLRSSSANARRCWRTQQLGASTIRRSASRTALAPPASTTDGPPLALPPSTAVRVLAPGPMNLCTNSQAAPAPSTNGPNSGVARTPPPNLARPHRRATTTGTERPPNGARWRAGYPSQAAHAATRDCTAWHESANGNAPHCNGRPRPAATAMKEGLRMVTNVAPLRQGRVEVAQAAESKRRMCGGAALTVQSW